ncbi:MAG: monothiol glutaredoxin, Grx4 family [Deltaproteobacteria bacterium]|nr:monothiol glutaredoxin, Grx4 family [Deltaproteobacteria bacterium]
MEDPLIKKIETILFDHSVVIFMKGTPEFPQCGYSLRACEILRNAGVKDLFSVNVLLDDALWNALEDYTKCATVPQIFINRKFIGGCEDITEMHESGQLDQLLDECR